MIDILMGVGFAAFGIMLLVVAVAPDHVTRDDNPITGRLCAFGGAVVCYFAAGGFLVGF